MQFHKTQTYQNLARAFAGECQAGMRYQMLAKLAMQEKQYRLADAVKRIAKNETLHATQFFNKLLENGGSKEDVLIDATYPFHAGTLVEGLKFAENDEKAEHTEIYPNFAEVAKREGFNDVAKLFELVAGVEQSHRDVFNYLANAVKNGTLYKSEKPMLWVCSECGYMKVLDEAWKICPLCKAEQGYVELHIPFKDN